ncbi:hypothetical protein C8J38_104170 [Rhizobium sp. PP-WC-2G-219]|nr:hypothetical protein C8J32_106147 [Rhizobium sp. PP-CC-3A-592]TCL92370.1 hypothetical protein C8J38_104170 [Rhizobium sp. PP-WC-2G-219]
MTLDDGAERIGTVRLLPSLGTPSANVADGCRAHADLLIVPVCALDSKSAAFGNPRENHNP